MDRKEGCSEKGQKLNVDERTTREDANGWEKLFDAETLQTNLLLASLYLTAYELLKTALVDRPRSFFTLGLIDEDEKSVFSKEYNDVKRLHKDPLMAACLWLNQLEALSDENISEIRLIRQHRNQIAHELPNFLFDPELEINVGHLLSIRCLLRKVGIWWARNVDMLTNPEFDNAEVSDEDIHPLNVLLLDEIIRLALENVADERK